MPTLTFTGGDDSYIVRTTGNYVLSFLAGSDTLDVRGGTFTTAHMGDGDDLVYLRSGNASVFGELGNDRFEVYAPGVEVDAGAGSDLLNIRAGSGASLHGGTDEDRFNFYGNASSVLLYGDAGADDFFGYYHSISGTIYGGDGNDYFAGFRSGVTLGGGAGNDLYRNTVGFVVTFVENVAEGTDTVQVARGDNFTLPANIENVSVQGFTGSTVDAATLTGNASNNRIVGHANAETIYGLSGNDVLGGKGGNDALSGGDGDDSLDGGSGDDSLDGGIGNDVLMGRTGNDDMSGGAGADTYYVDSLSDVIHEASSQGTDLVRTTVDGYTLADNVENGIVSSGVGGLTLSGNALNNMLTGNTGDDTLLGLDGNDVLNGGLGGDAMSGGLGDDIYYVDSTFDTVTEAYGEGVDTIYIQAGGNGSVLAMSNADNAILLGPISSALVGNYLNNTLAGSSAGDYVFSDAGDDIVSGRGGDDTIYGDAGDDVINGGDGSDLIYGDSDFGSPVSGADTLNGGTGNDWIYGGNGPDTMSGGSGQDTFVFFAQGEISGGAGHDVIQDFEGGAGGDTIDLSAIDANSSTGQDDAFTLVSNFTGVKGQIVISDVGGEYVMSFDFNGDGAVDKVLHVLFASNPGNFNLIL